MTPRELRVGEPVTFSGTACPPSDVARVLIDWTSTTAGTAVDDITPRADGSWTATAKVGDSTMLGMRRADAVCATRGTHDIVFSYPPVAVRVRTFRRLRISPSTVARPGDRLTVLASAGCPPQPVRVGVLFGLASPGGFVGAEPDVASGVVTTPTDRPWTGILTIPGTTRAGRYVINAYCSYTRAYDAWYESVPIVVTTAP